VARVGCVVVPVVATALAAPGPAAAHVLGNGTQYSAITSQNKSYTFGPCGGQNIAVALGAEVTGGAGEGGGTKLAVTSDTRHGTVVAEEDGDGFVGGWQLVATEECAVRPTGMQVVTAASQWGSPQGRSIAVSCPQGKKVLAAFGGVEHGQGRVILDDLRVVPDLTSVLVTGIEQEGGDAGSWRVTARAICVAPMAGQHRVARSSTSDSSVTKTVAVGCPSGQEVHGAGAEIVNGAGQVRPTAIGVSPG